MRLPASRPFGPGRIAPAAVYQFTSSGISVSAVATGTRDYPDGELNVGR